MARSFNGSSDEINTVSNGPVTNSALTYACWYYPVVVPFGGVYNCLFGMGTGNGADLYIHNSNAAYYLAGSVGHIDPGTFTFTANNWYHVAMTWDGTTLKGYVNGTADGSVASSGSQSQTPATVGIGYDNGAPSRFVNGYLADVAMWSVGLSSGNIASLANGVRPVNVNSANLVGWWPLDGYASPETDLSSNANNGTLTGTARVLGPPALWRISG